MAIITNTVQTYDVVGNREDLADFIYNVDKNKTPFISAVGKIKAKGHKHEWLTQAYAAASATNQQVQGAITTYAAVTPRVRRDNYCQISRKEVSVTGSQEADDPAGIDSELNYQTALKLVELRRDMEAHAFSNAAKAAGATGDATQSKAGTLLAYIFSNTSKGGGAGADPAGTGADARTNGDTRAFTEDLLLNVCQQIFTETGEMAASTKLYIGPKQKLVFNGFTGRATTTQEADTKKIVSDIKVYDGPFGMFAVVPDNFVRAAATIADREALLLDVNMWKLAEKRTARRERLAKTGDSENWHVLVEYTIEACNEKSSGGIFDLA